MTAKEDCPSEGHECSGTDDSTSSNGYSFEDWARKDLAASLMVQSQASVDDAYEIADAVRDGEPVDRKTVGSVRAESLELMRLCSAALIATESGTSPQRHVLASKVARAGTRVQDGAEALERSLENGEEITDEHIDLFRERLETAHRVLDEVTIHAVG